MTEPIDIRSRVDADHAAVLDMLPAGLFNAATLSEPEKRSDLTPACGRFTVV